MTRLLQDGFGGQARDPATPPPSPRLRRGATKAQRLAASVYRPSRCAHCGATYKPIKKDQSFCGPACKRRFHNLRQLYGGRIFDLAIAWRRTRAAGSFTGFVAALDAIIRDHKSELGHAISDGALGFGRMAPNPSQGKPQ